MCSLDRVSHNIVAYLCGRPGLAFIGLRWLLWAFIGPSFMVNGGGCEGHGLWWSWLEGATFKLEVFVWFDKCWSGAWKKMADSCSDVQGLGSAQLELAWALKYHEPGLGTRLRPGPGSAQAQAGALCKKNLKFNLVVTGFFLKWWKKFRLIRLIWMSLQSSSNSLFICSICGKG